MATSKEGGSGCGKICMLFIRTGPFSEILIILKNFFCNFPKKSSFEAHKLFGKVEEKNLRPFFSILNICRNKMVPFEGEGLHTVN